MQDTWWEVKAQLLIYCSVILNVIGNDEEQDDVKNKNNNEKNLNLSSVIENC